MKMTRREFLAALGLGTLAAGIARALVPPEPCFICGDTSGRPHVHMTRDGRGCHPRYIQDESKQLTQEEMDAMYRWLQGQDWRPQPVEPDSFGLYVSDEELPALLEAFPDAKVRR